MGTNKLFLGLGIGVGIGLVLGFAGGAAWKNRRPVVELKDDGLPVGMIRTKPDVTGVDSEILELAGKDGRKVRLRVYRPVGKGPFPTVIFSPARGMSINDYTVLGATMSRSGFLWALVDHPASNDSVLANVKEDARNRYRTLGVPEADKRQITERLLDLRLVLERIATVPGVDTKRLGVAGHLSGGFGAQAMAGAEVQVDGKAWKIGDSKVKAAAIFSPYGLGSGMGFTESSWEGVKVPMLLVTVKDNLPSQPANESARFDDSPFERNPGKSPVYDLKIRGGNPMAFIGWDDHRKVQEVDYSPKMAKLTVVFFRAHLLGDKFAQGQLAEAEKLPFLENTLLAFRKK